jgi:formylglycine-generating enzyme required for sulfatase activity
MARPAALCRAFFLAAALACIQAAQTGCDRRGTQETHVTAPRPGQPWTNPIGMRFVPVPGLTALVSVYETRASEFARFVEETGLEWIPSDAGAEPDYPAVNVTWDDAIAFCDWLTRRDRLARLLGSRQHYRLPTDAEWSLLAGIPGETGATPAEKARAGLLHYSWEGTWPPPAGAGNFAGEEAPVDHTESDLSIDGYRDPFERLAPVGRFTPNRFGLHDLAGNALEFCSDWFDATHRGRVARGGSWLSGDPRTLSATHRVEIPPRAGLDVTGFRCVLEL